MFLNKAAPSSALIWSQQITFLRRLPPTRGREGSSGLPVGSWLQGSLLTRGTNFNFISHRGSKEVCTSNTEPHLDEEMQRGAILAAHRGGEEGCRGGGWERPEQSQEKRRHFPSFRHMVDWLAVFCRFFLFLLDRKFGKQQKGWTTHKHTHKHTVFKGHSTQHGSQAKCEKIAE